MIWFGCFFEISIIVDYSMQNPFYTYILNIWFQNNILEITFLNKPDLILFCTDLNDFTYFYQIQIIQFTINQIFAHS